VPKVIRRVLREARKLLGVRSSKTKRAPAAPAPVPANDASAEFERLLQGIARDPRDVPLQAAMYNHFERRALQPDAKAPRDAQRLIGFLVHAGGMQHESRRQLACLLAERHQVNMPGALAARPQAPAANRLGPRMPGAL